MANAQRVLPETMTSLETGKLLRRDIRPFEVRYKGQSITVDLPGYYPEGTDDDDGVLIGEDMKAADEALHILKERIDGPQPTPDTIRSLRTKLNLSQVEAGRLFRVGENAFDKYERGLVKPSGPTCVLMKLLDGHPELVGELG